MRWYVLCTKPRHEKKVEKDLISMGIEAYCPTKTEYRIWSDRKKKIEKPVLTYMVLVRIEEKNLNSVFISNSVLKYLFWLGSRAVVRNIEVNTLKKNLSKSYVPNPNIGSKISISKFGNNIGVIEKLNNNKVWVSLEDLGYKLMLETS